MTTQPGHSKEKQRARSISAVRGRDWRYRIDYQDSDGHIQTKEQLSVLKCPFRLPPEQSHEIPAEFTENVKFYESNPTDANPVPWTGYYAMYRGARLAVSNAYGVWFEITREHGVFRAIRKARPSLKLKDWPCNGLDHDLILESGEPLAASK